jgi:hypothetical protein
MIVLLAAMFLTLVNYLSFKNSKYVVQKILSTREVYKHICNSFWSKSV